MEDGKPMQEAKRVTEERPPLSLDSILSDPETVARLAGIVGALQSGAENASPTASQAPQDPPSDGLTGVLADPALMEKLPQIMQLIKPMLASASPTAAGAPTAVTASRAHTPDREALLLSLKPFLSNERRAAVDSILRISRLGDILKQIK